MNHIIGHKILAIRKTTAVEREQMYWSANGIVLLLDNGVSLLPVTDEEANEPARLLVDTNGSNTFRGLLTIELQANKSGADQASETDPGAAF